MKIVVLDGYTLNPGDLSWQPLAALGEVTLYDRTPAAKIIDRVGDAEVVFTNKTPLSAPVLRQLPKLRYIGVLATGTNVVDVGAADAGGIVVTNVPAYGSASVAQTVFAHILNFTQAIQQHAEAVRTGAWSRQADFSFRDTPLIELAGLTLGIVGMGAIGRQVSQIGMAFGMRVIAAKHGGTSKRDTATTWVALDELLAQSDVVSLHCPLTSATTNLINARTLRLMRPNAFLINVSRGGLIDESALADALQGGQIAGAALDVLSVEPPPPDHPLLTAPNCNISPHLAWATLAARQRLMDTAVANLQAYQAGKPQNVVEPPQS